MVRGLRLASCAGVREHLHFEKLFHSSRLGFETVVGMVALASSSGSIHSLAAGGGRTDADADAFALPAG
jgi:hypothetical protein